MCLVYFTKDVETGVVMVKKPLFVILPRV